MDISSLHITTERFATDFKIAAGVHADKFCRRSGLSHDDVRRFIRGELPTREEFAKIRRFYPQLKKYTSLFRDQRKIVGVRSDPVTAVGAVAEKGKLERPARVEKTGKATKAEKPEPKVILHVETPKRAPAVTVREAEVPMPVPPRPSNLEVQQEGRNQTDEQFTKMEMVDPSLAELLLKGNVRNRGISGPLVEAMTRDMLAGAWKTTHQGLALDKEYRLLDGQHRLLAVVKSGKTIEFPITYNVPTDAFEAIDLGGRPRSISDIAKLSRGLKYGRTVIAAAKTIAELGHPSALQRWTKSEVDALLDIYQRDCEWAAGMIAKAMGSAAVTAGIAYAYPTDPEAVEEFAKKTASRVGMTSPMAALWNAYERINTSGITAHGRVELAHMTMRCVWAFQRGADLKKVYIRPSTNVGDQSKNANDAYRHYRHLRLKLGLHE